MMRGEGGKSFSGAGTLPWLLVAALWCFCLPVGASRAVGQVSVEPRRAVLRPGECVTIAWTPLPAGTEEFEILLASRSPMTAKIRLTESMDPALRTFAWRVPNLPCSSARLFVRVGVEGAGEIGWAWSAPFRIAWEPRGLAQRVSFREGEWWVSDRQEGGRKGYMESPGTAHFRGLPALPDLVEAPDQPMFDPDSFANRVSLQGAVARMRTAPRRGNRGTKPLDPPIRI